MVESVSAETFRNQCESRTKKIRRIEYEALHLVCYHCGCYGHKEEDYFFSIRDDSKWKVELTDRTKQVHQ